MKGTEGQDKIDHTLKLLTIGESGVGKTCILLQYTDKKFSKHHLTTIGIDFKTKIINYYASKIKLYIWDTAGQERFRNIAQQYYNGADGIFLVFDVTDRNSYDKVSEWMKQILSFNTKEKIGIILLGNKVDSEKRAVSEEEGKELASTFGIKYFETSAMNNYNLEEAFSAMVDEIVTKKKLEINKNDQGRITLSKNTPNKVPTTNCKC
jgi:small GTP-binding protein